MLFSEKWLRQWVNPSLTAQELMDQVTIRSGSRWI